MKWLHKNSGVNLKKKVMFKKQELFMAKPMQYIKGSTCWPYQENKCWVPPNPHMEAPVGD